jgi:hypothetical protein
MNKLMKLMGKSIVEKIDETKRDIYKSFFTAVVVNDIILIAAIYFMCRM